MVCTICVWLFFFNDTATTEIYTLSLHDALPISERYALVRRGTIFRSHRSPTAWAVQAAEVAGLGTASTSRITVVHITSPRLSDRKSTRLNSSHANISYAVFCLKKKKNTPMHSLY